MVNAVEALARSDRRVRLVVDAADATLAVPSYFVVSRADGAGTVLFVAQAFATDPRAYELSVSAPLTPGIVYLVGHPALAQAVRFSWQPAAPQVRGQAAADDPEAEALGVDVDWWAPALAPGGDMPELRGRASLEQDLVTIAQVEPGELYHRPQDGGGLPSAVNGPNSSDELVRLATRLRRQWASDARVSAAQVSVTADAQGATRVQATVQPVALADPLSIVTSRS